MTTGGEKRENNNENKKENDDNDSPKENINPNPNDGEKERKKKRAPQSRTPSRRNHPNPIIVQVGHQHIPASVDCDAVWIAELGSGAGAFGKPVTAAGKGRDH